jgi:hypothetical protein
MLIAWRVGWIACAICSTTRGYNPRPNLPQPEIKARDLASGASVGLLAENAQQGKAMLYASVHSH